MNRVSIALIVISGWVLLSTSGCSKDESQGALPTISTDYIEVNGTQLTMAGTLSSDGGTNMVSRGFCYDTQSDVTRNNNPVYTSNSNPGYGEGQEIWIQYNLLPNTKYYVRAFAENSKGVAYGEELEITTGPVFTADFPVVDFEGNSYNTVKIGSQIWMAENLQSTVYNDGSAIPYVTDEEVWKELETPGYCWLENNSGYKVPYGALYNWHTVQTGKLAPIGWRVPTDADWTKLFQYLGGNVDFNFFAGAKMKEAGSTHWSPPNSGATNESGWTGLPGMYRHSSGFFLGQFPDLNTRWSAGYWWSATSADVTEANFVTLGSGGSAIWISHINRQYGFSVRCIKN